MSYDVDLPDSLDRQFEPNFRQATGERASSLFHVLLSVVVQSMPNS